MELQTAIEILEYHQEWRLGKRDEMIHEPKTLTQALDVALIDIKSSLDLGNKTTDKIVLSVIEDLNERSKVGIKKYRTTLDRQDLTLLQWHQHQYEELLDAALYTKRIINELSKQV